MGQAVVRTLVGAAVFQDTCTRYPRHGSYKWSEPRHTQVQTGYFGPHNVIYTTTHTHTHTAMSSYIQGENAQQPYTWLKEFQHQEIKTQPGQWIRKTLE